MIKDNSKQTKQILPQPETPVSISVITVVLSATGLLRVMHTNRPHYLHNLHARRPALKVPGVCEGEGVEARFVINVAYHSELKEVGSGTPSPM